MLAAPNAASSCVVGSEECVLGVSLRCPRGVLVCVLGVSWSVFVLGDSPGDASQRHLFTYLRSVLECVLGLRPRVSEIVFRMCSQGVLECVLGMCPQSALAVSLQPGGVLECVLRLALACPQGAFLGNV